MQRFILTGAPGSGKTAIIRQLEIDGFNVVEEAATDVIALQQVQGIAEPWTNPSFIDAVARLQGHRENQFSTAPSGIQFHDRSIICTAALAIYLGHPFSEFLLSELARVRRDAIFQKQVFFVQNLGFITPTEARRISFEETLRFEEVHARTYCDFGYEIVQIARGTLSDRVSAIKNALAHFATGF